MRNTTGPRRARRSQVAKSVSGCAGCSYKPVSGRPLFINQDPIEEAGGTLRDIVDVVTYHVGLREHLALYKTVRDRFMQGHTPPWTAIGVSEMTRPGLILEIKVTAWLGGSG